MEIPKRYEDNNPEHANFIARVYALGGVFKQDPKNRVKWPDLPPVRGLQRNQKCPCNSGLKVKKCHSEWIG